MYGGEYQAWTIPAKGKEENREHCYERGEIKMEENLNMGGKYSTGVTGKKLTAIDITNSNRIVLYDLLSLVH